jgi:hypothetical protein
MPTAKPPFGLLALARLRRRNEKFMKKKTEKQTPTDDLRKAYDFSELKGGVRGKYISRYRAGTNLILLSPDVAKHFPDEQAVNTALRNLIRGSKPSGRRTR